MGLHSRSVPPTRVCCLRRMPTHCWLVAVCSLIRRPDTGQWQGYALQGVMQTPTRSPAAYCRVCTLVCYLQNTCQYCPLSCRLYASKDLLRLWSGINLFANYVDAAAGSIGAARSRVTLKRLGISHIVNASPVVPCFHRHTFKYKVVTVYDDADEDIQQHFHETNQFISEVRHWLEKKECRNRARV